ncbi:MAG TPA: response regulator [Polyangiaceae bacterium]
MLEVLLADDDANVRESIADALHNEGHRVTEASDGLEAAELIGTRPFDVAICDVRMPRVDGLTLFRRIRREAPKTAVVIMTSQARIPDVVDSLRDGAVDFVTKPFDPTEFVQNVLGPIAAQRSLLRKFEAARDGMVARRTGAKLVALSSAMRGLADRAAVLASSDASLVLLGDRGTGKELLARVMHAQGPRRDGPFALIDGAVLPELLETTGDEWARAAHGGTLVLDGIERLSIRHQAHLARAISDPCVVAIRGPQWEPLGVRIVTLTRERLADRVIDGSFLESLYYRLNGVQLRVPNLSERGDDLPALVAELMTEIQPPSRTVPNLSAEAWEALAHAAWPGNVRQLRGALEHALAMSAGGAIELQHLPQEVLSRR